MEAGGRRIGPHLVRRMHGALHAAAADTAGTAGTARWVGRLSAGWCEAAIDTLFQPEEQSHTEAELRMLAELLAAASLAGSGESSAQAAASRQQGRQEVSAALLAARDCCLEVSRLKQPATEGQSSPAAAVHFHGCRHELNRRCCCVRPRGAFLSAAEGTSFQLACRASGGGQPAAVGDRPPRPGGFCDQRHDRAGPTGAARPGCRCRRRSAPAAPGGASCPQDPASARTSARPLACMPQLTAHRV